MPKTAVRVLNFDNSVLKQLSFIKSFQPRVIDLVGIAPSSRIWLNKKNADFIRSFILPSEKGVITLLGSGDFHHVSSLLIEQFAEPLSVIIFDFHPDWDVLPPRLGCGSWVSRILKQPNIEKVVMFGVSSGDISSFWIQTGNLSSLKNNRVEIYPYAHEPTLTFCKTVPENASLRVKRKLWFNKICWQELKTGNLTGLFFDIASRIQTKRIYISIDKDCLRPDFALTNWEPGLLDLKEVTGLLRLFKENFEIVGVDIVGEYSLPKVKGAARLIASQFDHPKNYSARGKPESRIISVNEKTNLEILKVLLP